MSQGNWWIAHIAEKEGYAVVNTTHERDPNIFIDQRRDLTDPTEVARLVAAAPELLAACVVAIRWFEERGASSPEDHIVFDKLIFAARSAMMGKAG